MEEGINRFLQILPASLCQQSGWSYGWYSTAESCCIPLLAPARKFHDFHYFQTKFHTKNVSLGQAVCIRIQCRLTYRYWCAA